ncbi:MAG: DUF3455 domain-containing protein [Betaproteobacteria bacterium]|nr:DUF3455 domain-containing protein [Betaproteobacteria bacterium]
MKTTPSKFESHRNAGLARLWWLPLALAACATQPPLQVPATLAPKANETLAMTVAAKGVQVYECRGRKEAGAGYEWAFVAPEAELLDAGGRSVGRHGAGPYWQASDGSKVVGKLKARADAPAASAIPWLLVEATTAGPEGAFSKVTSIQRVNTAGGLAPAGGCTLSTAGATARIPYTADYRLFVAR